MAFDDEEILQNYLARLMTWQDERDDWLGEDDLQRAARDLGLTDADLARIAEAIADHRRRGRHFGQHGAWNDAVEELRQAAALAPLSPAVQQELATAYASRYQATHASDDLAAARRYARRAIQLDPDYQPAYHLLSALDAPAKTPPAQPARRALVLGAAGLLVLLGGVIAFLAAPSDDVPPAPPASTATPPPPGTSAADRSEWSVPVRLEQAEALHLDVQRSVLKSYDSTFSYILHATLHNTTDELHRLRIRLDMLGSTGQTLHAEYYDVVSDYQPPLRPGDTAPVQILVYKKTPPPAAETVRLTADLVERMPAASDYGTAVLLPVTWESSQPPGLDLDLYERESRLTDTFSERMHFLTLAVRNNGERAVSHLRLKAAWLDAEDQPITSELTYAVPSSGPALEPGQTWVARLIGKFPKGEAVPYDRYVVSVVDAE